MPLFSLPSRTACAFSYPSLNMEPGLFERRKAAAFLQSIQGCQHTDGCISSLTFLFGRLSGEGEEGLNYAGPFHKKIICLHPSLVCHGESFQLTLDIDHRLLYLIHRSVLFQEYLLIPLKSNAMTHVSFLVLIVKRRSPCTGNRSFSVSEGFP